MGGGWSCEIASRPLPNMGRHAGGAVAHARQPLGIEGAQTVRQAPDPADLARAAACAVLPISAASRLDADGERHEARAAPGAAGDDQGAVETQV